MKCHKKEFGGGEGRLAGRTAPSHSDSCHSLTWELQTILVSKGKPHPANLYAAPFGPKSMAQKQSISVGRHGKIAQAYTAILVLLCSIVLPFSVDFGQYDHLEKQIWLQRAAPPFTTNHTFSGQHWVSPVQAAGQQEIHRNPSGGCGIPERKSAWPGQQLEGSDFGWK